MSPSCQGVLSFLYAPFVRLFFVFLLGMPAASRRAPAPQPSAPFPHSMLVSPLCPSLCPHFPPFDSLWAPPLAPPIDTFFRFVGDVLHILKRQVWVPWAHSNRASLRDAVISFLHFQVAFFAWSSEGLAGAAGAAFLLVFSLAALCFFVASACTRVPTSHPFSTHSMPVFPLCPSLCPLFPPFGSLLNLSCPQIFLLSDCFFPFHHV